MSGKSSALLRGGSRKQLGADRRSWSARKTVLTVLGVTLLLWSLIFVTLFAF